MPCAVRVCFRINFLRMRKQRKYRNNRQMVPTTAKTDGETISYSELGIDEDQFGLDFKDSSNCTVTLAGISCDSAYTFNGTSVDLTVNGTAYKLSYDSGVLTMVLNYENNRIEFSFTKQR